MTFLSLYFKIQLKIEKAAAGNENLRSTWIRNKNFYSLLFWKTAKIIVRFFALLFGDSSENYLIFTRLNKDSVFVCNNSFCQYKRIEKRVRFLSKTVFVLVLISTILTSSILYFFMSKPGIMAATFDWAQADWSLGLDTAQPELNYSNQGTWKYYEAKTDSVSAGVGNVSLSVINTSWLQTNWITGAYTDATAAHATDRNETWTKFYSKEDTYISSDTDGQLKLSSIPGTYTETSDTDFNAGNYGTPAVTQSDGAGGVKLILPPAQVTGLTATSGNAQAVLNWTAPANNGSAVTSYKVYQGTTSGGETLLGSGGCSGLGNVLTCTDASLTNGTTYYYKVAAVNAIGEGSQSSETNTVPGYPYTIATGSCSGTITTEYKVYYADLAFSTFAWKTALTDCPPPPVFFSYLRA